MSAPTVRNRLRVAASILGQSGLWTFNKVINGVTVPDTPDQLAEFLSGPDAVKVYADPEHRKEFLAHYSKVNNKGEQLSRQISEQVANTVAEMLKDNGVTDRPDQTEVKELVASIVNKPGTGAEANAAYNPKAPGAKLDGVVNDLGEFARLINSKMGKTDEQRAALAKIQEVQNAYSTNDPASAGFLIPEEMRSQILQLALEQGVVRSRSTVITMTSLTQKIPYVDAKSHASSVFGGMVFYWTEEAGQIIATEAKFGRVELSAKKLTGGARVPNELWADASALSSWLMAAVPSGLAYYEDLAFLSGSGVGEPLGVYNSSAKVTSTRSGTGISSDDIFKMYARMLPQSLNRAVWVANQETLPELLSLTIAVGSGGSYVGLVQNNNIAGSPQLSILGRPLIITEKAPALNAEGDISFIDFSHYLVGDRQSVSLDSSEHSRFMNDETELRVIERVDGRPWLQNPITPKNGTNTLSPFVVLEAD